MFTKQHIKQLTYIMTLKPANQAKAINKMAQYTQISVGKLNAKLRSGIKRQKAGKVPFSHVLSVARKTPKRVSNKAATTSLNQLSVTYKSMSVNTAINEITFVF